VTTVAPHPAAASTWTSGRVVGAVLTCLAVVIGATLFGAVGSILGIMALSITVGAVARTVLVLGVLALVLVTGYRLARGGPTSLWLASGLLAYLLFPAAWDGRALIATAFGLDGISAWLLDAVLWTVAVVLVVRSREPIVDDRIDTSGLH
jgi:hypothetical protein